MKKMLKNIKRIESQSYPSCYRQMEDCNSIGDIVEYCEAKDIDDLIIITGKTWYFLAVKSTREIVDLAGKTSLSDLFKIKRKIKEVFSGLTVKLDARENTSYRIIKRLGKVVKDYPYSWNDEVFHEMEVLV